MKTLLTFAFTCIGFFLLLGCENNDQERRSDTKSVKAAINPNCETRINFEDLNDNVYAYRADDIFGVLSIQAGGHSTSDESTDLGVNIFLDLANITNTDYTVSGASGIVGTAHVFYIDGSNEYISTYDNTEILVIEVLEFEDDLTTISKFRCSFNNVEVENNMNSNDLLCVNGFELVYNR